MKSLRLVSLTVFVCAAALCPAGEDGAKGEPPPPQAMFSTNMAAGPAKAAPFSPEISADFIKKVMETSAKIEACKKEISARQAYLYESNPKIKEYRSQMVEMQKRINAILDADKELAELRLNRDIAYTTMPALPRGREPQGALRAPPVK